MRSIKKTIRDYIADARRAAGTLTGTAVAAGPFDGTYKGSQTVQQNNNCQGCSDRNDMVVIIQNNHFARRWADTIINVDVTGDGTFSSQSSYTAGRNRQATASITGRIAGGALEADIGSDRCASVAKEILIEGPTSRPLGAFSSLEQPIRHSRTCH